MKWLSTNQNLLYPPLIPCLELNSLGSGVLRISVPFIWRICLAKYVDYALSGTIYFQSGRPMSNRLFNRIQTNTPCNFFLYGKLFSLVGILTGTVAYRTPGRKDLTKVDRHFSAWHFIVSNCYKNLASWLLAITYYLMYMYEPLFYSKFSLNWL